MNDMSGHRASTPRILAHMCCAPCSVHPLKALLAGKASVSGFFYNPNIHPRSEFARRLDAARKLSGLLGIDAIFHDAYDAGAFLGGMNAACPRSGARAPERGARCPYCYGARLSATAAKAVELGFDAFTTTLLFSRYQMHEDILKIGLDVSKKFGVSFYYEDFRAGWNSGRAESRGLGLYSQNYCGCAYSLGERLSEKRLKKQRREKDAR